MAKSGSRLFFFLALIGVWWCCASIDFSEDWSINMKSTPSSSSRYYILNDWQNTYSQEKDIVSLPAAKISDIMLKTMGILRDGASWPGVQMGNLFSRPLATAMFLIDGLSPESSFEDLSSHSFGVDQTHLSGCTCGDAKLMFRGDNVARHLSDLFDQTSQTSSVSASTMAARAASANGEFTPEEQLKAIVTDIQDGGSSLSHYNLQGADQLDVTNKVDAEFIAELVLIQQTLEKLKELNSYVNDLSPDVFIFTISTLQSMERQYGSESSKMAVATKLVKQVIQEANSVLVQIYNGQILVQALVMQWNHPAIDTTAPEIEWAYHLLRPYLVQEDKQTFISGLPSVVVRDNKDSALCKNLKDVLSGSKFYATCSKLLPDQEQDDGEVVKRHGRRRRSVPATVEDEGSNTFNNATILHLAESRTTSFSAIFLITLFVTVSLGLALYAVSCSLWNMDPGRDSIIYRQVSDPGMRMQ